MTTETSSRRIDAKSQIPVQVLCGFLGSGKTTLLSSLLKRSRASRTAVVICEFGEIPLDHLLIESVVDDDVFVIDGCPCCIVRDDLSRALLRLWLKRSESLIKFDRVVIEAAGVSDPAPIMQTVSRDQAARYMLAGVICTVDGLYGRHQLEEHFEAVKQVALASLIVVTKTDLTETKETVSLKSRIRCINPSAVIHCSQLTSSGESSADTGEVFEIVPYVPRDDAGISHWLNIAAFSQSPLSHPAVDEHGSETAHNHFRIESFCLITDVALDWPRVARWLQNLGDRYGEKLLRVKGILNLASTDRPFVIHGVHHTFYPPVTLTEWPDDDHRSRIVFITREVEKEVVEKTFARDVTQVQI